MQPELLRVAPELRALIRGGMPALALGASNQPLGDYLETSKGERQSAKNPRGVW